MKQSNSRLSWQAVTLILWRQDTEAMKVWKRAGVGSSAPEVFCEAQTPEGLVQGVVIGGDRLNDAWDRDGELIVFTRKSMIVRLNGPELPTLTLSACPKAFEDVMMYNDTRSAARQHIDQMVLKSGLTFNMLGHEKASAIWMDHARRLGCTDPEAPEMPVPHQLVWLGSGLNRALALVIAGRWDGPHEGFNLYHPLTLFTDSSNVVAVEDPVASEVYPVEQVPA
ncbi:MULTISPECIES: hypothetical protein [Gluconobacter]|uniref:hypothetical protein n=1 Tax=Gluconobacter TaxID=441 RepID=UPI001B8CC502|nr:hypothetical protein [Gluconobacter kondonii]MBS1054317.1 hypothetical protein [Gluconobacter kondonii]MBS1057782.1 hypothetical protein [Gluconobacter kondonii]